MLFPSTISCISSLFLFHIKSHYQSHESWPIQVLLYPAQQKLLIMLMVLYQSWHYVKNKSLVKFRCRSTSLKSCKFTYRFYLYLFLTIMGLRWMLILWNSVLHEFVFFSTNIHCSIWILPFSLCRDTLLYYPVFLTCLV